MSIIGQYRATPITLEDGMTELPLLDQEGRLIVGNATSIIPPYNFAGAIGNGPPPEGAYVAGLQAASNSPGAYSGPGTLVPFQFAPDGGVIVTISGSGLTLGYETLVGNTPTNTTLAMVGALRYNANGELVPDGFATPFIVNEDGGLRVSTQTDFYKYDKFQGLSLGGGVVDEDSSFDLPSFGEVIRPFSLTASGELRVYSTNSQSEYAIAKETENLDDAVPTRKIAGVVRHNGQGSLVGDNEITHIHQGISGGLRVETHANSQGVSDRSGVVVSAGYAPKGELSGIEAKVNALGDSPSLPFQMNEQTGGLLTQEQYQGPAIECNGVYYTLRPNLTEIRFVDNIGYSATFSPSTNPLTVNALVYELNNAVASTLFELAGGFCKYVASGGELLFLEFTDAYGQKQVLVDMSVNVNLGRRTPPCIRTFGVGQVLPSGLENVNMAGVRRASDLSSYNASTPDLSPDVLSTDSLGALWVRNVDKTPITGVSPTVNIKEGSSLGLAINTGAAPLVPTGRVHPLRINASGELLVAMAPAPSGTSAASLASYAADLLSQVILPANALRKSVTVYNKTGGFLYLRYSAPATIGVFKVAIPPMGYWEMPNLFLGDIHGICDSATGNFLVAEEV